MRVTIVGGSLSGLTLSLACAHRGIETCVLERASGARRRGGTLGVDRALLLSVIGENAHHDDGGHPFPVVAGRRRAVAWQALYGWLRSEASRQPAVTLEDGVSVTAIDRDGDDIIAVAADGRRFRSDLIVGADGYRSFVRRVVNPEENGAKYAGYLLWRGLVDEAELAPNHRPRDHEEAVLVNEAGHRLVVYAVAGRNGSLAAGERLLSFTWYDAGRTDLLRELGCVSNSSGVLRTLSEEDVPVDISEELRELAGRIWPDPWRSVIIHALERRQVFATPVAESFPFRLVSGRLAIIGDAAHLVSPVMGRGFLSGIGDAAALADCLAHPVGEAGQTVLAALAAYEARRLPEVHSLVSASLQWSRAFVGRWNFAAETVRKSGGVQNVKK